jgi:hypothetical protein
MERHAVGDATDILDNNNGAVRSRLSRGTLPPTHSGMPHEMPPTCRVSLVLPQGRVRAPKGVCVPLTSPLGQGARNCL